jgi:hypothetical protein
MAVTKILARKGGLKNAIAYVMNGDKTEEQLLVATHLCTQDSAYEDMTATKQRHGKTDGVQCYHLIQSFQPGEITPELALEVAQITPRSVPSPTDCVESTVCPSLRNLAANL